MWHMQNGGVPVFVAYMEDGRVCMLGGLYMAHAELWCAWLLCTWSTVVYACCQYGGFN